MTRGTKLDEMLKRNARRAFLEEERVQQSEQRVIDEEKRQAANAAKTAKLREQRLANEAAEREAAKPKARAPT
jgi:hypothetical protein